MTALKMKTRGVLRVQPVISELEQKLLALIMTCAGPRSRLGIEDEYPIRRTMATSEYNANSPGLRTPEAHESGIAWGRVPPQIRQLRRQTHGWFQNCTTPVIKQDRPFFIEYYLNSSVATILPMSGLGLGKPSAPLGSCLTGTINHREESRRPKNFL
ncbi:hypothetical protein SISSUDRAFT_1036131 [Sistotremastrum suecicum HHB10207 ss-3]|uniref:Uncharacterized protein n=1 Tax=Sistotremastrum suecicum HHB10207 ss-3 TaxID=1314776 RepID=A0A165ZUD3_9AGAM|nr:hypothetical protein SISSUDRAFT_1036131 [Sistotremastrum suecicum HHB10207 ss-3]